MFFAHEIDCPVLGRQDVDCPDLDQKRKTSDWYNFCQSMMDE